MNIIVHGDFQNKAEVSKVGGWKAQHPKIASGKVEANPAALPVWNTIGLKRLASLSPWMQRPLTDNTADSSETDCRSEQDEPSRKMLLIHGDEEMARTVAHTSESE